MWATAGSPEFSTILAMAPTEVTVIGKQPSDRRVPDLARGTGSSPANSGGLARPSCKRCVVGSRYIFAKRCVVGSHLVVAKVCFIMRYLPALLACALMILSGTLHGLWTNRWVLS